MDKPESFEIQEYSNVLEPYETYRILKQVVQKHRVANPVTSSGFRVQFVGDQIKIFYTCLETNLPSRMSEVEKQADVAHKDFLKYLKKEFKAEAKHTLNLSEDKKLADYSVQKVSLNERYYYSSWRFYTIS